MTATLETPGLTGTISTAEYRSRVRVRVIFPPPPAPNREHFALVPAAAAPELVERLGLSATDLYPDTAAGAAEPCVVLGTCPPVGYVDGYDGLRYEPRPSYPEQEARDWTRRLSYPVVHAELARLESRRLAREEQQRFEAERERNREALKAAEEEARKATPAARVAELEDRVRRMEEAKAREARERAAALEKRLKELGG